MATLYWHDYETWGTNPAVDRPAQFAGVRTDEQLNIIGDPLVIYCRPADDVLPHPEACLVTGIAPQKAVQDGLIEAEFIGKIHQQLALPGTVGVGYNSLRFDDEVTRYTLYRNFYDPYQREWQHGNGRWDIIDLVRLCYALRPDGIEWPIVDGRISFRLELLTQANNIAHTAAHDAYADVEATIKLARLIKQAQPKVYDYVFSHRSKDSLRALIDWQRQTPLLHISSRFPVENRCAALVMPIAMHPTNKNAVIVYNLSEDPQPLLELDSEQIAARVFCRHEDLAEGQKRIPLKLVHLNKCPILATAKLIDDDSAERLNLDKDVCRRHWQILRGADIARKVQAVMSSQQFEPSADAEQQLYQGFVPQQDRAVMDAVRSADGERLKSEQFVFKDKRLQELLWRYKARNFPESLSEQERHQWFEFCRQRLSDGEPGILSVSQLKERLRELDAERDWEKAQKIVLQQLYRYTQDLMQRYQVGSKCQW